MDDGKANALSEAMSQALMDNLDLASEQADVIIITGRPGLLCAGFDLKVINGTPEEREAMVNKGGRLLVKAYLHPQPIIVACTGHAVAAGALLCLTGDYRIGVQGDFRIGLNETSIGLSLPVFGQQLARDRLDNRMLTQATLMATLYEPEQAVTAGFLDELVSQEAINARALAMAQQMKKLDGKAFAQVKKAMRGAIGETISQSLDQ
jgi:enoyl-CoA hydratase